MSCRRSNKALVFGFQNNSFFPFILFFTDTMWIFSIRRSNNLVYVNTAIRKGYVCIRKSFERACERAKISGLTLHDLRRTFATRFLQAGVDIISVSELLGHTSVTATQIYCMSSAKSKQDAVAWLDPQKKALLTEDLAYVSDRDHFGRSQRSNSQWN
jgi:hypothetical protein